MTHMRPLSHSISLLSELPVTSDIQLRPSTLGGVAFILDSGFYKPCSTHPWKKRGVERIVSSLYTNKMKIVHSLLL